MRALRSMIDVSSLLCHSLAASHTSNAFSDRCLGVLSLRVDSDVQVE